MKIEQTFGILKKVFASLRSLRIRVDRKRGHRRACEWIRACCVIYNIIRPMEDVQIEDEEFDRNEDDDNNNRDVEGEERRSDLFHQLGF